MTALVAFTRVLCEDVEPEASGLAKGHAELVSNAMGEPPVLELDSLRVRVPSRWRQLSPGRCVIGRVEVGEDQGAMRRMDPLRGRRI
jgi:hypothetical protein